MFFRQQCMMLDFCWHLIRIYLQCVCMCVHMCACVCVWEGGSKSVTALSQNMLHPVLWALVCCSSFTLDPWGVCVYTCQKRCKWAEGSDAWNIHANSNKGYWPWWHLERVCACSRVPRHLQHFWMTNWPTNGTGWVEPSLGGLLSYSQSP